MKVCNLILALCIAAAFAARASEGDWRKEVTIAAPGKFPALPSVRMHFSFGWSNVLEAGSADAIIQRRGTEYRAVVNGGTKGIARGLWKLDAQHVAAVFASSLLPKRLAQIERYSKRTVETQVRFDATGLNRMRKVSGSTDPAKWKRVNFMPVHDIIGGVLYVRSQPLNVGDEIGVVCFPGDSAYLVVVKVEQRETIRCMGKKQPAIRLSLGIRKLEIKNKAPVGAVSYEKFKSGTVWVSDDALRLPLRAEINVFIGFVYGELTKFDKL